MKSSPLSLPPKVTFVVHLKMHRTGEESMGLEVSGKYHSAGSDSGLSLRVRK